MPIGGQAVIEGVMMRDKERYAVAVRLPNGKIRVKTEKSKFPKFFDFFFIRGIVGLAYMLKDGISALQWSSNQQLGEEEKISKKEMVGTILVSLLVAVLFFIGVPFFTAKLLQTEGILFNLVDGLVRVLIFLGYLGILSRMKDVQTLFQYHGAEHKTIYCYEANNIEVNKETTTNKTTPQKFSIKNIQQFPKEHHRCGTAFIFLVLIISILVFSLLMGPWWVKLGGRLLLLPVIAGIGYEIIKFGDRFPRSLFTRILLAPGLWLQKITTKEPSDKQVEVAVKALEGVVGRRWGEKIV